MKIIRPYAKLMPLPGFPGCESFDTQMGLALLRHIEWSARISHRSEDAQLDFTHERVLKSIVIDHGDWSVVEHAVVSVDAVMDRGITHEWVRHRLFGFTQESTRFVNYEKKMPPSFIYPIPEVECPHCLAEEKHERSGRDDLWLHGQQATKCFYHWAWLDGIYEAERHYVSLLAHKWRPQEARSVFPNALASRIVTTGNLRNWRHFLIMRTCSEAHPQMRQITIPLLKEFQSKIPMLFDDIIPNEKQSLAMKKAR